VLVAHEDQREPRFFSQEARVVRGVDRLGERAARAAKAHLDSPAARAYERVRLEDARGIHRALRDDRRAPLQITVVVGIGGGDAEVKRDSVARRSFTKSGNDWASVCCSSTIEPE